VSKNKNLSGGLFAAKPTPLEQTETSVSAQIADWLNNRQIYNDRLNCVSVESKFGTWIQGCKKGTPDRFAIIQGIIIFIEVKKFGKKPTPEQLDRMEEIENAGAVVIVADSFNTFLYQFVSIRSQIESGESLYK
jgi:hypothetical protein